MILLIVVAVLNVGVICAIIAWFWKVSGRGPTLTRPGPFIPDRFTLQRSGIKHKLDVLLWFYQQGVLTEERYLNSADELVDELSTLLHEESHDQHYADTIANPHP